MLRPARDGFSIRFRNSKNQSLYDQFKAGGAFEGRYRENTANSGNPNDGIGSTKNGISCGALMANQAQCVECPSDPTDKRVRDDQSEWLSTLVFVTDYKGVLDDTFLGEGFPGTETNAEGNDRHGIRISAVFTKSRPHSAY